MSIHRFPYVLRAALLVLLFVYIQGCGYDGEFITLQSDFSVSIAPGTVGGNAGSSSGGFNFTITPIGSFHGVVSVSLTPPAGFSCAPVSCTVALPGYTASNLLPLTPALTVLPGTYPLDFVATSGSISHHVAATFLVWSPVPTPDFAFSVTPTTSSVQAGSAAPAYSFSVTPANGFTGAIAVTTALPAGFTCIPANCTATFTGTQAPSAIQITPSAATASGTYTVTFTATSGSLSHTATATINVTVPPPPPPPSQVCAVAATPEPVATTRTGFAYTGDPSPSSLVYDAPRNRILVTNLQNNELDIVSPETMTVTGRLSVPQPMGVDLTPDGKTIVIGTRTHFFYRATADTLCITDRRYLAVMSPLNFNLSPMFPTALADGSVLFRAYDVNTTAQTIYLWTASAGFTQLPGFGGLNYSVRTIVPSADRMHAFLSGDDSGGLYGRYDVMGGASSKTVAFGSQPTVLAVNQDGTRALINNDCCGITLVDRDFNSIASYKGLYVEGAIAEPDFSRFYLKDITSRFGIITDSSLNSISAFSATFSPTTFARTEFAAFDGAHRILSLADHGVAFVDISRSIPVPGANTALPFFSTAGYAYGAFTPSTPESGLQTTANGANFAGTPSMVFYGATQQGTATGVSTTSSNSIKLTAPSLPRGCADVNATFPSGLSAYTTQAFCYSPVVFVADGDSAPTTGGSTLTLYALGLGSTPPIVTIGGTVSSKVTITQGFTPNGPFQLQILKALVPPGNVSDADITITAVFGSTTLPRAFHYAQRQDTALPSGARAQQLLLDAPRGRILITDSANNQLLVYGLGTGALLESIPTGPNPQGISLTPDGTRLLLLTAGDYKVSVLDAATYATEQQATLPTTGVTSFISGPAGPGTLVSAMAGNKAYITTLAGYLQGGAGSFSQSFLYDYDLLTNTLTTDPAYLHYPILGEAFFQAASTDGSTALIGGHVSHAVGGPFVSTDGAQYTVFSGGQDSALSSDGHVISSANQLFDNANRWQNSTAADYLIQGYSALGEPFLYGEQFNATGSLLYRPTPNHLRIYDVQHGNLRRTLEVPDGITGTSTTQTSSPTRLLAVPPAGQQIVTVTGSGLSIFTFATDPLSVAAASLVSGTLTLSGSGFSTGTIVKIDTLASPPVYVSTSQLTVPLPTLAPGAHSVTVTNPNGDTYTLTLAFTTP